MENKKLTFKELIEIYKREISAEEKIQNYEEPIENYKEKISNFKGLIENYYKRMYGSDVVFDFMNIVVHYTYMDLGKKVKIIHQDGTISVEYRDERVNYRETVFVPFITSKEYYDKNLSNDSHHEKRTLDTCNTIDIGSSNNFNYDEIYKRIYEVMPKECQVISEGELGEIAKEHGYDNFVWHVYDRSVGLPPIAYNGPEWVHDVYGVKEKNYESIEESKNIK